MKKLFFCFLASTILSSCTSGDSKEIGRYAPMPREGGNWILDTKTGVIYYTTNGYDSYYVDLVTTAQKRIRQ